MGLLSRSPLPHPPPPAPPSFSLGREAREGRGWAVCAFSLSPSNYVSIYLSLTHSLSLSLSLRELFDEKAALFPSHRQCPQQSLRLLEGKRVSSVSLPCHCQCLSSASLPVSASRVIASVSFPRHGKFSFPRHCQSPFSASLPVTLFRVSWPVSHFRGRLRPFCVSLYEGGSVPFRGRLRP